MKFIGGGAQPYMVMVELTTYYIFISAFKKCMLFSLTSNMEMFFNTIIRTNIQLKLSEVVFTSFISFSEFLGNILII